MIEAQFDTGATHDTRILIGCWALVGKAPDAARAIDARTIVISGRIHFLPYPRFAGRLLDVAAWMNIVGDDFKRALLRLLDPSVRTVAIRPKTSASRRASGGPRE